MEDPIRQLEASLGYLGPQILNMLVVHDAPFLPLLVDPGPQALWVPPLNTVILRMKSRRPPRPSEDPPGLPEPAPASPSAGPRPQRDTPAEGHAADPAQAAPASRIYFP